MASGGGGGGGEGISGSSWRTSQGGLQVDIRLALEGERHEGGSPLLRCTSMWCIGASGKA